MHKSASNHDRRTQPVERDRGPCAIALAGACSTRGDRLCASQRRIEAGARAAAPAPMPEPAQPMRAGPDDDARPRSAAAGKLVLGYRPDAAPMSYRDAAGQADGLFGRAVRQSRRGAEGEPLAAVARVSSGSPSARVTPTSSSTASISSAPLTRSRWRTGSPHRSRFRCSRVGSPRWSATDASMDLQRALEERPPPYQPLWRGTPPPTLAHRTYRRTRRFRDARRAEGRA